MFGDKAKHGLSVGNRSLVATSIVKLNGEVGFIKTYQQIGGVEEVARQSQRVVHVSLSDTVQGLPHPPPPPFQRLLMHGTEHLAKISFTGIIDVTFVVG